MRPHTYVWRSRTHTRRLSLFAIDKSLPLLLFIRSARVVQKEGETPFALWWRWSERDRRADKKARCMQAQRRHTQIFALYLRRWIIQVVRPQQLRCVKSPKQISSSVEKGQMACFAGESWPVICNFICLHSATFVVESQLPTGLSPEDAHSLQFLSVFMAAFHGQTNNPYHTFFLDV